MKARLVKLKIKLKPIQKLKINKNEISRKKCDKPI